MGYITIMIKNYLHPNHYDLTTPDGKITSLSPLEAGSMTVDLQIENISPTFVGYHIEPAFIVFNLKSTLAQLGVNAKLLEVNFDQKAQIAYVKITLYAISEIALLLLQILTVGAYIGKLFAADPLRRVREPEYLLRMFARSDRQGRPLLSLGGLQGSKLLSLEKIEGRTVAFLALQDGALFYESTLVSFLPTLAKSLLHPELPVRSLLQLHQKWYPHVLKRAEEGKILLVRTLPLHVRTVFGKVVDELLPAHVRHTTASILQPDTTASGDIYELYGSSSQEITHIPLEFYTLEPFREYVFFQDRDQLQTHLENQDLLFNVFRTATSPIENRTATFIVKGEQLLSLTPEDWITRETPAHEFPGLIHPHRQALLVQRYIEQQPTYPILKAIEEGSITSQGVMFMRYFPSPMMKREFLSENVQRCLKGIYFQFPSRAHGNYFSHEDRSFLLDLAKFAIPVYWVDQSSGRVLQYIPKPDKDAGMFVPLGDTQTFLTATSFGIYGSCMIEGTFEKELSNLMKGILHMRTTCSHPLLNENVPIALITGGGPGVMEVGNRVAKELGILSCANIVDFSNRHDVNLHEQKQNPYIEAKMTYRIDRLIERQAEFNLDFPIFLAGGIGTDFEFSLEALRRKVGSANFSPVLLMGPPEYWKRKITSNFQCNVESGTIAGSEWIANCLFCIQTAAQGLKIYSQYFNNTLQLGPSVPYPEDGFIIVN